MESQIVRTMDNLRRIVLPAEMTSTLGWEEGAQIAVTRRQNGLLLETYRDCCSICGSEKDIHPIHGKFVCRMCIDELNVKV